MLEQLEERLLLDTAVLVESLDLHDGPGPTAVQVASRQPGAPEDQTCSAPEQGAADHADQAHTHSYLPGDANMDGCVDGLDYVIWSNNYEPFVGGKAWGQGDFNADGMVDGLDYVAWSNNYLLQMGCFPHKHVPYTGEDLFAADATSYWSTGSGALTNDVTNGLELTFPGGDDQTIYISTGVLPQIDARNCYFRIRFMVPAGQGVGLAYIGCHLRVTTAGGGVQYSGFPTTRMRQEYPSAIGEVTEGQAQEWLVLVSDCRRDIAIGDLERVDVLHFFVRNRNGAALQIHLQEFGIYRMTQPQILLKFDGGYDDHAQVAQDLADIGVKVSFAIWPSLVGRGNYVSWAEVEAIQDLGHQILLYAPYEDLDAEYSLMAAQSPTYDESLHYYTWSGVSQEAFLLSVLNPMIAAKDFYWLAAKPTCSRTLLGCPLHLINPGNSPQPQLTSMSCVQGKEGWAAFEADLERGTDNNGLSAMTFHRTDCPPDPDLGWGYLTPAMWQEALGYFAAEKDAGVQFVTPSDLVIRTVENVVFQRDFEMYEGKFTFTGRIDLNGRDLADVSGAVVFDGAEVVGAGTITLDGNLGSQLKGSYFGPEVTIVAENDLPVTGCIIDGTFQESIRKGPTAPGAGRQGFDAKGLEANDDDQGHIKTGAGNVPALRPGRRTNGGQPAQRRRIVSGDLGFSGRPWTPGMETANMWSLHVDTAACHFPTLTIIMAHSSDPWWEDAWTASWSGADVHADIPGGTGFQAWLNIWADPFRPGGGRERIESLRGERGLGLWGARLASLPRWVVAS